MCIYQVSLVNKVCKSLWAPHYQFNLKLVLPSYCYEVLQLFLLGWKSNELSNRKWIRKNNKANYTFLFRLANSEKSKCCQLPQETKSISHFWYWHMAEHVFSLLSYTHPIALNSQPHPPTNYYGRSANWAIAHSSVCLYKFYPKKKKNKTWGFWHKPS